MSEHNAEDVRCYWCGAMPPCPPWQHRDPDEPDSDPELNDGPEDGDR